MNNHNETSIDSFLLKTWALLLMTCAGTSTYAGTVSSPFELNVDSSTLNGLLATSAGFAAPSGEVKLPIPDQTDPSYNVSLKGISIDLKYAFDAPKPNADFTQWTINSVSLSAVLSVQSVTASQTITSTSGGTTLTYTINGQCSNVQMILPPNTSTQASGQFSFSLQNGRPVLQMTNFSANWAPSSWTVPLMNCQGPNGFGQLVAQTAEAKLRTIDPFLGDIRDAIEAQLAQLASAPLALTLNAPGPNAATLPSVTLKPDSFSSVGGGRMLLQGTADFLFPGIGNSDQCGGSLPGPITDSQSSSASQQQDSLLIPFSALEKVLQCSYYNQSLNVHMTSADVPAFQWLEKYRIVNFFVWPDLMSFSRKANFGFDLEVSRPPTISNPTSGGNGVIDVDLDLPLSVSMEAPVSGGGFEHYLDFNAEPSSRSNWQFVGDQVTITQKDSDLKIFTIWDGQYVLKHNPDTFIAMGLISSRIKAYLAKPGLQYTIPSWVISSLHVSVDGANLEGENLRLGIKVAP